MVYFEQIFIIIENYRKNYVIFGQNFRAMKTIIVLLNLVPSGIDQAQRFLELFGTEFPGVFVTFNHGKIKQQQ